MGTFCYPVHIRSVQHQVVKLANPLNGILAGALQTRTRESRPLALEQVQKALQPTSIFVGWSWRAEIVPSRTCKGMPAETVASVGIQALHLRVRRSQILSDSWH